MIDVSRVTGEGVIRCRSTRSRAGSLTSLTFSGPVSLVAGHPVGGAGAFVTTAVCAEVAVAEPLAFVAVTRSRSVRPRSAATTVYLSAVAPLIVTHSAPAELHRSHWST